MRMNYYVMNKETQKLELYFVKEDYMALSEELPKKDQKQFLFLAEKKMLGSVGQSSRISGGQRTGKV